jgi:hypothetical protein
MRMRVIALDCLQVMASGRAHSLPGGITVTDTVHRSSSAPCRDLPCAAKLFSDYIELCTTKRSAYIALSKRCRERLFGQT